MCNCKKTKKDNSLKDLSKDISSLKEKTEKLEFLLEKINNSFISSKREETLFFKD